MEINLNDNVCVTLTERGAEILNDHERQRARIIPNYETRVWNEGNIYKTQLWCLFALFGNEMHMGMNISFEKNNIIIEE